MNGKKEELQMKIKKIEKKEKPEYDTKTEKQNKFLKLIFEHKKITLSLTMILIINYKNVYAHPIENIKAVETIEIAGNQVTRIHTFLSSIQWVIYGVAFGYTIYEIIFNIINYKNFKSLSKDEKQKFTKKRIKKLIFIVLLLFIIGTLFGWTVNYCIYK